jgi:molecular chaperone GrpE
MSNKEKNSEGLIDETSSPGDQNAETVKDTAQTPEAEPEVTLTEEEKLKFRLSELNEKFLRLYAEFDNYKKRTSAERFDLIKTAGKDVIVSLLPVLDDFDRALHVMDNANDIDAVKEGVQLVKQKFSKTLEQRGLKEMECLGNDFNSDIQEAITSMPVDEDKKGKVVEVIEKGYMLNDKVIRFAKVIVGN